MAYNKEAIYKWRKKNLEKQQEYSRRWREKNPEKVLAYSRAYKAKYNTPEEHRRRNLKRYYDMSVETYETLLSAQGKVCAICGKPPTGKRRLAVDHNHADGSVRGLLCNMCNRALSLVENDPDWPTKAINYLARHIEQTVRN